MGVVDLGVTPSAAFTNRVGDSYDRVYAELKNSGQATWASDGEIPDELAPHVEALMAFEAADSFFVSDGRYMRILAKEKAARREIRRLVQPDYESLDDPVDY